MSKIVTYKAYTIKSCPLQQLTTGQWKPHISISWDRDGIVILRPFSAENTYPTEEQADIHGSTYGQRIIDGKVPGLSVD
jgi:hypothetical protein